MKFSEYLKKNKTVIGMIHVRALPGTPNNQLTIDEIVKEAVDEAKLYERCGLQAVAIENMHDVPYLNREVGPEIISAMTVVGREIKNQTNLYCGIQILAGANKSAVAAAYAANLDFVRAEGFVFAHIADEGTMNSDAGELLRYRKMIGAEEISIFTDIKKKHSSHAVTSDIDLLETVKAAEYFLSDGVIITGSSTGKETDENELISINGKLAIPVLIGSGVTAQKYK